MLSVRHHPFSRLVEIRNLTGSEICEVRIRFSTEGSGDGVRIIAERLEPNQSATWSLGRERKRVRALAVSYRIANASGEMRTESLRAPQRAYFRWLTVELHEEDRIYGFGRAQGIPRPTYYPSGFSAEAFEDEEADAPEVREVPFEANEPVRRSRFIELVSFASSNARIRALSVLDTDGQPHELPVDITLRPGAFLDLEIEGRPELGVHHLKVAYEKDQTLQGAVADFRVFGHDSVCYATVVWMGEADTLDWMGQANWGGRVVATPEPVAPIVTIEPNTAPEFPDAFCGSPMRLRNNETYPVHVRYAQTFWNEGPEHLCSATPTESHHECTLPSRASLPLGCSQYRTPNMWCSWNRSWQVISAMRLP